MNVLDVLVDERLLRAVDASRRLRRQTRAEWLRGAVERHVASEVVNIRPIAARSAEEEEAVLDLLAWMEAGG